MIHLICYPQSFLYLRSVYYTYFTASSISKQEPNVTKKELLMFLHFPNRNCKLLEVCSILFLFKIFVNER